MDKGNSFDSEFDAKLCTLSGSGDQTEMDRIKNLVQDSRYVCTGCGRTAANEENLCSPEEL